MTAGHAMLGLAMGVVAGGAHLALTWWRARWIASGRLALGWLGYPLGLIGLGLVVFGASRIGPLAAWSAVGGLLAVRLVTLHLVRGRT